MTRHFLSETIGQPGVFSLLDRLLQFQEPLSFSLFEEVRVDSATEKNVAEDLLNNGLLARDAEKVLMTTLGQKSTLLLRAINDRDELGQTFQKLGNLFPYLQRFHLIEGNVTEYVVEAINTRRDFIRLYICSPWIRLKEPHLQRLKAAVMASKYYYPQLQILVITLPLDRYKDANAFATLRELRSMGATIMTHRKLHAKLYISEPGPRGGSFYAVFGSENLTGANNIELGLKVENDNEMLTRLRDFFLEIEQESTLLQGEII